MANYKVIDGSVQHLFMLDRHPIRFFGGGYANGKTAALCAAAIQLARDYPGSNGLIARESYPKLNDTIRKEFFKWCPPGWVRRRPTKDDNTAYLKNNSQINFRYLSQRGKQTEDGSTTGNLLSATYDWAVVDQIEDPGITYKDFLDLIGRLRGTTPYRPPKSAEIDRSMPSSGPRWLLCNCNPTHNWVYRQIIQPYLMFVEKNLRSDDLIVDPDTKEPLIKLFESSTYANAHNLTPDFIRNMEATYKGQMRARFLMGEWAAFEGLVYPNYDEKRHMIGYEEIMNYLDDLRYNKHVKLEAIEAYDFGMKSPSVYGLGAKDQDGRILLFDGF